MSIILPSKCSNISNETGKIWNFEKKTGKRKRKNILNRHKHGNQKKKMQGTRQLLDPIPSALSVHPVPSTRPRLPWKTQVRNIKLVRDLREQRLAIYMVWFDVLDAPAKSDWKGNDGTISIICKLVCIVLCCVQTCSFFMHTLCS